MGALDACICRLVLVGAVGTCSGRLPASGDVCVRGVRRLRLHTMGL